MRYLCTAFLYSMALSAYSLAGVTYDLNAGVTQCLWDNCTDYEWTHENVSEFSDSETSYTSGVSIGSINMTGNQEVLRMSINHRFIDTQSWIECQNEWYLRMTFDEPTEVFHIRYTQMLNTTWLGPLETGSHYFAPGETLELTGLAYWTDGGTFSDTFAYSEYQFNVVEEQIPCGTQLDPAPCNVDLDDNGSISVDDLLECLDQFNLEGENNIRPRSDSAPFPAGDCVVNIDDLLMVLQHFGKDTSNCGPCAEDEIVDCNGNCAPTVWVGDNYCDDGSYDYEGNLIYLNCDAYNCDGGDCFCP